MSHAFRTIALALPCLALAPVTDELTFHPAAQAEVAKKLEIDVAMRIDDVSLTVNGQPMPAEATSELQNQELKLDVLVGVLETYVATRDGRPIDLLRTFEDVAFASEFGGDKSEADGDEIEGKTVRFRWNEESQGYDKSYEGDAGDPERLTALSEDMDLRLLLPGKKVAEGDTWEVAGEKLLPLFMPGFVLDQISFDEEDGEAAEALDAMREELGEQMEAFVRGFTVTCTYAGTREVEKASLAEIRLRFEGGPKLDVASLFERVIEMQDGEAPDADIEATIGVDLDGEGTLLWDQAAGRAHAFDMNAKIGLDANVEARVEEQGQSFEVTFSANGAGDAAWKLGVEKR